MSVFAWAGPLVAALGMLGCGARQGGATRDDGPPPRAFEHFARAEVYAARGAHDRAMHELAIAVAVAGDDLYLRVRLAEEIAAAGQPAAARDLLDSLIAAAPSDPAPLIARARLRLPRDGKGASADLERALALSPDPQTRRQATILYAAAAARAGKADAAAGRLVVLSAAQPGDLGLIIALAEAQAANNQPAASFATLDRALAGRDPRRPGTADLLVAYARLSLRRGDHDQAVQLARRAHGGDPNHVGALLFLAEDALDGGRAADAAPLLARARLLAPRDPAVMFVAARASDEPLEAERLLLSALGAYPATDLQEQIERRLGMGDQVTAPAAAAASPAH